MNNLAIIIRTIRHRKYSKHCRQFEEISINILDDLLIVTRSHFWVRKAFLKLPSDWSLWIAMRFPFNFQLTKLHLYCVCALGWLVTI